MSQLQLPDPPKWDPNDYSEIDYDKVAKDDITEYVKWCTTAYEVDKWRDHRLWEVYQVNFANFTEEAFCKASQFYVAKLKNFLRDNGVYVEMSRKVKMTEGLYNAAQEEEQATWPPDELQKEIESGTYPEARAYDDNTDPDDLQELTEALILNTTSNMTMDTQEPKSETFFTSIGNFNYDDAMNMRITLADRAFEHAITGADSTVDDVDDEESHSGPLLGFPESDRENQPSSVMTYNPHQGRYSTKEFHGILIDTGAAIRSTAGLGQFLAYNRAQKDNAQIDKSKSYAFKFGIGSTSSIGVATIVIWIDIHLRPPDHIVHDAGSNFVSKEFKQYANSLAITTKAVPVEAHWSIGVVERYHPILKRAYAVIVADIPEIDKNNYGKELALQMAVKAVNDTAGPDGLVPTLLVFGAYPKMSQLDPPAPTIAQRATAVKKAMEEVTKIRATRAVQDALNQRNGPDTSGIHELPIGSEVLVWREGNTGQSGKWTGPHTLLGLDGETCKVQLQGTNGTTDFRSTTIKPYLRPSCDLTQQLDDEDHQPDDQEKVSEPLRRQPQRQRQLPERYRQNVVDLAVFLEDTDITGNPSTVFAYGAPTFSESRNKEINGLLEKGVFKIINRSEIPHGTRIFNSRFVDEIKNSGTNKAFEKSRLVVQAYNDHGKDLVLTQSPTIQRVSQRLILALTAMLKGNGMDLYLRDITQAYTQSTTLLRSTSVLLNWALPARND